MPGSAGWGAVGGWGYSRQEPALPARFARDRHSLANLQFGRDRWCLRVVNEWRGRLREAVCVDAKSSQSRLGRPRIITPNVADRRDDQTPAPEGRETCTGCGGRLAPDQRYCIDCGRRRGRLPGAVAGVLAALSARGRDGAAAPAAEPARPSGERSDGWSWMPSPQAIAIAVIGMLALGVGLGSAMSEIASSAPLSTILLEYPQQASEPPPPAEEPEEVEEEAAPAEAPVEEAAPAEVFAEEPLPQPVVEAPLPEARRRTQPGALQPGRSGRKLPRRRRRSRRDAAGNQARLPDRARRRRLRRNLRRDLDRSVPLEDAAEEGRADPQLLRGHRRGARQRDRDAERPGPTTETAVDCPEYTAITPATVSVFAEQVEGEGCVYPETVESLPTQLGAAKLSWRAYVEDMENGGALGQPFRCRKPALGGPDWSPTPSPGDQYVTWRNPVVYFGAIAEGPECEKVDVGFELLSHDLQTTKQTPALSLIFPNACHSGGEYECEPGAPKGAQGAAALLKTLVPAIMHSPAYEEGGLIMITSAEAPQTGEVPTPAAAVWRRNTRTCRRRRRPRNRRAPNRRRPANRRRAPNPPRPANRRRPPNRPPPANRHRPPPNRPPPTTRNRCAKAAAAARSACC